MSSLNWHGVTACSKMQDYLQHAALHVRKKEIKEIHACVLTCAEGIKDELETRETGQVEGGWESGRKRGNESGAAGVGRDDTLGKPL